MSTDGKGKWDNVYQACITLAAIVCVAAWFIRTGAFASVKFDILYGIIVGGLAGILVSGVGLGVVRFLRRKARPDVAADPERSEPHDTDESDGQAPGV